MFSGLNPIFAGHSGGGGLLDGSWFVATADQMLLYVVLLIHSRFQGLGCRSYTLEQWALVVMGHVRSITFMREANRKNLINTRALSFLKINRALKYQRNPGAFGQDY